MKTIEVKFAGAVGSGYEVRVGSGLLAGLGEMVRSVAPAVSCGVVTDSRVGPLYLERVKGSLEGAGYRVMVHVMPAGEEHKTLSTVGAVLDTFLRGRVERATPVVALGGGVVGDLAGFAAASLLRGVPFVQVPTTLLAAVDASVGGKVGVDHEVGKNLIGAFHQPRLVMTDTETFRSLPGREVRCGLAECVKHGVIKSAELFGFIEERVEAILAVDAEAMGELVARNVAIKASYVMADPFEQSVRAELNLGHTFGHAIETVVGYAHIAHGEGVALGMVAAGRVAVRRGMFLAGDLERLVGLLKRVGLPTRVAGLDVGRVLATMYTDKKVAGGKLRLILPAGIGKAEIVLGVSDGEVREAIESLEGGA